MWILEPGLSGGQLDVVGLEVVVVYRFLPLSTLSRFFTTLLCRTNMATLSRNKLVQYLAFSTLGLLVSVSEASIPRRSLHQSREIVYARNTTTSTITTTTTATIDVAAPTISPVNVSNNTNSTSSPNVDSSNPTSGSRSVVYFPNW